MIYLFARKGRGNLNYTESLTNGYYNGPKDKEGEKKKNLNTHTSIFEFRENRITIKCWYCPEGEFDWSESIDCVSAQPGDLGAKWKSALCPHCNHSNWVLVKCAKDLGPEKTRIAPIAAMTPKMVLDAKEGTEPKKSRLAEDSAPKIGPRVVPIAIKVSGVRLEDII